MTEVEKQGRRAAAWFGWRWMQGMVAGDAVVARVYGGGRFLSWATDGDENSDLMVPDGDDVPDMQHPATQGCCIVLIAEHNARKSTVDALADIRWSMDRGLSLAEAILETMYACEEPAR